MTDDPGHVYAYDPNARQRVRGVQKHNCRLTLDQYAEAVAHFVLRATERRLSPSQAVIVLLNVDDPHGGPLADNLMPGENWQQYRDRGEIPYARGLAERTSIQGAIGEFDPEAAAKLQAMDQLAVVVVDYGVAEVFPA